MKDSTQRNRRIKIAVIITAILLTVIVALSVRITDITITGNERYSKEEMTDILFDGKWDKNLVYCYFNNKFKEHETIPFVESYKIVFQGFNKIEVIIYEKRVVGYVTYMSSNMYFDKDGIIVESTNKALDGIPWVTGLKFGHIVLYQPLPVENDRIFDDILNLTQALFSYELKVDKIKYDNRQNVVLSVGDIEVNLGDNTDINGKIGILHNIIPELAGRKGTLDLSAYDKASNMIYTFIPLREK